jgi:hypothetical protein
LGGRDSRTDGGKGAGGRRLEWQRRMEKEDTISVQWAQGDVETSYSLLNNNNNNNRFSNSLLNIIIIIIDLAIPASYSLHYAMAEKLQKYAALTGIRRLKTANIILQNGHYTKQVTRNCDVSYFVHSLTSITSSIFQTNARNIHNTYIFTKSLLQVSVCYTSSSCREHIVLRI